MHSEDFTLLFLLSFFTLSWISHLIKALAFSEWLLRTSSYTPSYRYPLCSTLSANPVLPLYYSLEMLIIIVLDEHYFPAEMPVL